MGFWFAGFVLVRRVEALQGLILAKSWAFLDTRAGLNKQGLLEKLGWKAHFKLGPRSEWTWKQANYMALASMGFILVVKMSNKI